MSFNPSQYTGFRGQHAVVIGAGMAGLLAGRVLSDHFERVTLIDRDRLPVGAQARKGVPQGRHVHFLLGKGASILEKLFPDLFPTLIQAGSIPVGTSESRGFSSGSWRLQFPSNLKSYFQSRPFLEWHVRDHLAARANVCFIDGCKVARLCANGEVTRITGVHLQYGDGEHREEDLPADLVVDASGRGSQAPQWLTSLGYAKVEETRIKVDVGYATRIYRQPRQHSYGWKSLHISSTPPNSNRVGAILPIEGECWLVTLMGWLRDYPPDDDESFLEYARSLPAPDLYEAIKYAEPVTPIVTYKFPANQRRHYERLSRIPEGFVVLGDALCSFNPVYGQGMTVAALEASTLNACLHRQRRLGANSESTGLARRFQKEVAKVVNVPWQLATSGDFRLHETQEHRSPGRRLLQWYARRVRELAASEPRVALRLHEVAQLLKPPTALLDPHILFAVLFKGRHLPASQEAEGLCREPNMKKVGME